MYQLSNATRQCIEDFVKQVIHWSPRALTRYEKSALAYSLFTILRGNELHWENSSRYTEDKDIHKNRFKFALEGRDIRGSLCIKLFFNLAQAVSDYLELENSIFDDNDDDGEVGGSPAYSLFMDLVFLFHRWEENYAAELAEEDAEDEEVTF